MGFFYVRDWWVDVSELEYSGGVYFLSDARHYMGVCQKGKSSPYIEKQNIPGLFGGDLQRDFDKYPLNHHDLPVPSGSPLGHVDRYDDLFYLDAFDGDDLFSLHDFCDLYGEQTAKTGDWSRHSSQHDLHAAGPRQSIY